MAGQRGYNQKALDDYLALARETNDINIIRRASRIASFLRNDPAAIEMGNMWLAKEPESQEALRTLAFQMVSLGRYQEALNHMKKLLTLGAIQGAGDDVVGAQHAAQTPGVDGGIKVCEGRPLGDDLQIAGLAQLVDEVVRQALPDVGKF